jgi:predicted metal-dependent enzyme (double-stranded beta helix superfamily)
MLKIINEIENCEQIDSHKLIDILKNSNLKAEDFIKYNNFDHPTSLSYGRNKIYEGKNFSVFLMSWAKDDYTAIHSHGHSNWGAVYLFGGINHRLYQISNQKLILAEKSQVRAGTLVPVEGNLIHAMGNLDSRPLMSLHIYGSNNSIAIANDNSSVFELEKKQTRITNGAAYINIENELCKQTLEGIETNMETLTDYLQTILHFYKRIDSKTMIRKIEKFLVTPEIYFEKQLV